MVAASWVCAYCANAVRIESVVMSPNDIRARSLVAPPATKVAIASKSWR
jgi:hypothetical protein